MKPCIILTRPINDSASLKAAFNSFKFDVRFIPLIEITPSVIESDSLHSHLENCTSIIFTSSNAVSAFKTQIERNPSLSEIIKKKEIYTIGEKTFSEASQVGGQMKALPKMYSTTGVIELLKGENVQEKRFLFLTGNISKKEIPEWIQLNGGKCVTLELYKNSSVKLSESDRELFLQAMRRPDNGIIFYSPSAVESLFLQIPIIKPLCAFFAIGDTTKNAILKWNKKWAGQNEKWTVITPSISNEIELIKSVQEHFNLIS